MLSSTVRRSNRFAEKGERGEPVRILLMGLDGEPLIGVLKLLPPPVCLRPVQPYAARAKYA